MVVGHNFQAGEVLASLTLDDPSQIKRPAIHTAPFPNPSSPTDVPQGKPHHALRATVQHLRAIMQGFAFPAPWFVPRLNALVDKLFEVCTNRRLPLLEMRDLLATLSGRIPADIEAGIQQQLSLYEKSLSSMLCRFPAQKIDAAIYDYLQTLPSQKEQDTVFKACQDIFVKTRSYVACDVLLRLHADKVFLEHACIEVDRCQWIANFVGDACCHFPQCCQAFGALELGIG